jgi:hypothetical protein
VIDGRKMHEVKERQMSGKSSVYFSPSESLIAKQWRQEIVRRKFGRMGESK